MKCSKCGKVHAAGVLECTVSRSTDYADRIQSNIDSHLGAIDQIVQRAAAENRDLTEAENTEAENHRTEVEALKPQLERWVSLRTTRSDLTDIAKTAPAAVSTVQVIETLGDNGPAVDVNTQQVFDEVRREFPTVGDMARAMIVAKNSKSVTEKVQRVQRALAKVLTSDTPGLLPVMYVGDLWGRATNVRPVVDVCRKLPLPTAGMDFRRPKITQHTKVDEQLVQKTEVASQTLKVDFDTVTLRTLAGAVNMSIQEAERTDPSALQIVFEDLTTEYGIRSEQFVTAQLAALTGGSLALNATEDAIMAALFTAQAQIYKATRGKMGNVIIAGLGWWGALGAAAKSINPQNANVTADLASFSLRIGSLRAVVSPELPDNFLAVANSDSIEVYEQSGAPIELKALEVGILGYEIGVYGLIGAKVWDDGVRVLAGGAAA